MYLTRAIILSSVFLVSIVGWPMIQIPASGIPLKLHRDFTDNTTNSLGLDLVNTSNVLHAEFAPLEFEEFEVDKSKYIHEHSEKNSSTNALLAYDENHTGSSKQLMNMSSPFFDSWVPSVIKQGAGGLPGFPSLASLSSNPIISMLIPSNPFDPTTWCRNKWAVCVTVLFQSRKCCVGLICVMNLLCEPIERKKKDD